jgi:D-glycero-alpha-D-manno-heptose-7-phosphate kinase
MITTKTPFRVSLFGGGTDHPDWFNANGGMVVSMAIDKYCYVSARRLPPFFNHKFRISYSKIEYADSVDQIEHPVVREGIRNFAPNGELEIHHQADLPGRSGIGSSSAFAVGLINALLGLRGEELTPFEIANAAIDLERNKIGEVVGFQDQIACTFGGLNQIEFNKTNNWVIKKMRVDANRKHILESSLVLAYSGLKRHSSDVSKSLLADLGSKQNLFEKTYVLAREAAKILESNGEIEILGEMLKESWHLKKESNPFAVSDKMQLLWDDCIEAGALGGKILGAGGGGFFLFWVPESKRIQFHRSMSKLKTIPIQISESGTQRIFSS